MQMDIPLRARQTLGILTKTCAVGMLLARVSPSLIAITMTQPAAILPPRNLGCRAMPVGKASAEEASPTPIDTDPKVRRR